MKILSPRSRFRLYGTPSNYLSVAKDIAFRRMTRGDAIQELEARVSAHLGIRHAICMPQARVGIYLALRNLIQPGQKVVLSPYTIHEVINMVICAGGVPSFADINRQTTNIDAAQVERLVDEKTGAVMVTHLHGLACDVERILAFCDKRGVPLLEDTAQAFGARVGSRYLGTFGRAGIYSFGMAKNVNSFYGGMLVTDDDALAGCHWMNKSAAAHLAR